MKHYIPIQNIREIENYILLVMTCSTYDDKYAQPKIYDRKFYNVFPSELENIRNKHFFTRKV